MKRRVLCGGLAVLLVAALILLRVIRVNGLFVSRDAARGVDVSEYQGEIDWPVLAAQNVRFAYIRATEGSGYADPRFAAN